jgi:hypothetical protein
MTYGAESVGVTPAFISVDLFVLDMSLVLAPLPDLYLEKREPSVLDMSLVLAPLPDLYLEKREPSQ